MATLNSFTPKQSLGRTSEHFAFIEGGVTSYIAEYFLTLLPDFGPDAIIHENACGNGSASKAVIAKIKAAQADAKLPSPKTNITIHATDINPLFVSDISSISKEQGWDQTVSFQAENADCQSMPHLATSRFTHSITGFVLQQFPNIENATREILRTMKPGAAAGLTGWMAGMPHFLAIDKAHAELRARDSKLMYWRPKEVYTADYLTAKLREAGFVEVSIREKDAICATPRIREWAESIWGFMGLPTTGWTPKDEEQWDKAIDIIEDSLRKSERVTIGEDGKSVKIRMTAFVLSARKPA